MCHWQEPMYLHYTVWGSMHEYVVKWLSQTSSCFYHLLIIFMVKIFSAQFSTINYSCPAIPHSSITHPPSLSESLSPLFTHRHSPPHHSDVFVYFHFKIKWEKIIAHMVITIWMCFENCIDIYGASGSYTPPLSNSIYLPLKHLLSNFVSFLFFNNALSLISTIHMGMGLITGA